MKAFNKEDILVLANELQFTLNDNEIKNIEKEFEVLLVQLQLMNEIDTSDTKKMVYPFDAPIAYLRTDQSDHVLSVNDALKNAPKTKDGYVVVPKVVK